MSESKRRKAEIADLKLLGPKDKILRHIEAAKPGAKAFIDGCKAQGQVVDQAFKKRPGETYAEFTHRVLNDLRVITDDLVAEILGAAKDKMIGSEVFPDKEQVICYYVDRSCIKVTFKHGTGADGGDELEIQSGREIMVPAHVKTDSKLN